MAAKFTWLEKFTRTLEKVPETDRGKFALAIIDYGTYGTEPSLEFPYDAIFEGVREDIDYSIKARESGAKGGKSRGLQGCLENDGRTLEKILDTPSNPPSEDAQANTIHSNTVHKDKESGAKKRTAFSPPTPEDVSAYAVEKSLAVDAERFCDFYASKGWKVGSSSMKDWKAAVRNWGRRDGKERDAKPSEYSGAW